MDEGLPITAKSTSSRQLGVAASRIHATRDSSR